MSDPKPAEESLMSHLLELRSRLVKALMTLALVFVVLVPFANDIYSLLAKPLLDDLQGGQLIATAPLGAFTVPLKCAFFAALMIAMPMMLYQLWAFVAPGLYKNEKRMARPLLVVATLLFYAGCTFTYFGLLPVMFGYLFSITPEGVTMMPDIGEYLDFVLIMFLAGGISFEVPVAVIIAVLLGWVKPAQLSEWRGYVIVAIFIIAAIITPPDGLSQLMLAIPMCLLYEIGILAARFVVKNRKIDLTARS
ncbi:MAG TPA: twin-arginine translocase subunit TatC [Arenimonas sp.]|nr:twin-arginine translocase subunit TatC [Arenimonas sp.]HPO23877.1 twin-arginine translocase subunit TatC [Arenimonas sp.]HPW31417.1 twin-arginine translocase subunit TatC [Arenimonas sp.]